MPGLIEECDLTHAVSDGRRWHRSWHQQFRRLERAAHHEAGHAVAMVRLGFGSPEFVEVFRDGRGHTARPAGTVVLQDFVLWSVVILAGAAAVEPIHPSYRAGSVAAAFTGDMQDAVELEGLIDDALAMYGVAGLGVLLSRAWRDDMDLRVAHQRVKRLALKRTRALVGQWWEHIARVAGDLLVRSRLTASEIRRLCADTGGSASATPAAPESSGAEQSSVPMKVKSRLPESHRPEATRGRE